MAVNGFCLQHLASIGMHLNQRFFLLLSLAFLLLISCNERRSYLFKAPPPEGSNPGKNEAVATFAGGCYWHTEIVFQSLAGVRDAVTGYSAGAESVNVYYDSTEISFQTLVNAFFASHDPTQLDRQGQDIGPKYRSVGFYRTPVQKGILEKAVAAINASGRYQRLVATELLPFHRFDEAYEDQQEYIANHPEQLYVKYYNIPDYLQFRQSFAGPFKDTLIQQ